MSSKEQIRKHVVHVLYTYISSVKNVKRKYTVIFLYLCDLNLKPRWLLQNSRKQSEVTNKSHTD